MNTSNRMSRRLAFINLYKSWGLIPAHVVHHVRQRMNVVVDPFSERSDIHDLIAPFSERWNIHLDALRVLNREHCRFKIPSPPLVSSLAIGTMALAKGKSVLSTSRGRGRFVSKVATVNKSMKKMKATKGAAPNETQKQKAPPPRLPSIS